MFERLFAFLSRGHRDVILARRAEARGELARAAELWTEAARPEEAARVMLLRGDGEADARLRLQHYTQALAAAPDASGIRQVARLKRALLVIAMSSEGVVSSVARQDLLCAAKDLEEIGEQAQAACAYALAGDTESEARALASAGDVEKLEDVLTSQQARERAARQNFDADADIELLVTSGQRRDALAAAEARVNEQPDDLALRERAQSLRARRATGPIAHLVFRDRPLLLVVGEEVVIGRTLGAIQVPSHAISRQHLRIARENGAVAVRDLGSRNGTQLRGMDLSGEIALGEGLELKLGREVTLHLWPSTEIEGAVEIDLAGAHYVASLGPAKLPGVGWQIEHAADGWLELVSPPGQAFVGDVALVSRTTLLVGDAIAPTRRGAAVLRVEGTAPAAWVPEGG